MTGITIDFPVAKVFQPFLVPSRYKAAYGGRGSGKSHFFADLIVSHCRMKPTRAVGIREVQNSIKESVQQLILDKIKARGLESFFTVKENEIHGQNGSQIIFRGMQAYNAENIKSLEGYDIAWVEEAQTLSKRSLEMLRPTIRKPDSEIWFSWNPRHDTDAVDEFFRRNPPRSAIVERVNYYDNPWLPDTLKEDIDFDKENDLERFNHVWLGGYDIVSADAYYSKQMAKAEIDGRISNKYVHIPQLPVITSWDIGVDDYSAVWFWQIVSRSHVRLIDFYQSQDLGPQDIVLEAFPELIKDKSLQDRVYADLRRDPYNFEMHYFPHDIKVREWGGGAKSRLETVQQLGFRPVSYPATGSPPQERINAVRRLLPICHFNRSTTEDGIRHLRRYSKRINRQTGMYEGPKKDGNDHAADAFGEYALRCPIVPKVNKAATAPEKNDYEPAHKQMELSARV